MLTKQPRANASYNTSVIKRCPLIVITANKSCSAIVLVAIAVLLSFFPLPNAGAESRRESFSIVFMSDFYNISETSSRGGMARIASYIKSKKISTPQTLVIHGGDALSPSLMSIMDQGAHMIDVLNLIGLDAFIPGNHEFDFGEAVFLKRMSEAKFPILAANLRKEDDGEIQGILDFKIIKLPNAKIGLIGLSAEDSSKKSRPESLRFRSALEESQRRVKNLRDELVDLVILVTHSARAIDNLLIKESGADIILSGDDHDVVLMYNGKSLFVEAGHEGEFLVEVNIDLDILGDGRARKVKWRPGLKVIDVGTWPEDEFIKQKVSYYEKKLAHTINEPLAQTLVELDSRSQTLRSGEARLANLFTDAIRFGTNADLAILNGGSFRGNRLYQAGSTLTRQHILRELPFLNKAIVLEITGQKLKDTLEKALSGAEHDVGSFPQISGFSLEIDLTKPAGQRVTSISKDKRPIELGKLYTLATNDFLAKGGDGYDTLPKLPVLVGENDAQLVADYAARYLQVINPVDRREDGRITLKK